MFSVFICFKSLFLNIACKTTFFYVSSRSYVNLIRTLVKAVSTTR